MRQQKGGKIVKRKYVRKRNRLMYKKGNCVGKKNKME